MCAVRFSSRIYALIKTHTIFFVLAAIKQFILCRARFQSEDLRAYLRIYRCRLMRTGEHEKGGIMKYNNFFSFRLKREPLNAKKKLLLCANPFKCCFYSVSLST